MDSIRNPDVHENCDVNLLVGLLEEGHGRFSEVSHLTNPRNENPFVDQFGERNENSMAVAIMFGRATSGETTYSDSEYKRNTLGKILRKVTMENGDAWTSAEIASAMNVSTMAVAASEGMLAETSDVKAVAQEFEDGLPALAREFLFGTKDGEARLDHEDCMVLALQLVMLERLHNVSFPVLLKERVDIIEAIAAGDKGAAMPTPTFTIRLVTNDKQLTQNGKIVSGFFPEIEVMSVTTYLCTTRAATRLAV